MTTLYAFCGEVGPFKRCDSGPDWFPWLLGAVVVGSLIYTVVVWMRDRS